MLRAVNRSMTGITFFIQVSLNVAWPCFDSSIAHLIICATLFWFKYRSLRIVCTYFHSIIAQLENQVLPSLICCAARAIELNRVHTSSTYPHIQFLGNFWGKIPTRTVSEAILFVILPKTMTIYFTTMVMYLTNKL